MISDILRMQMSTLMMAAYKDFRELAEQLSAEHSAGRVVEEQHETRAASGYSWDDYTENEFMKLELDVASTFHKVGAFGEKSKAASINVHLSIPRPEVQQPTKDVTPIKQSLSQLVSDGSSD